MALQTTGLEFFYLSVDFGGGDKILLVEQELGYIACIALVGTILPQRIFLPLGKGKETAFYTQHVFFFFC